MKQISVLVTGVGAIIGYGIINSLRKQNDISVRIVGMDIFDDAYGQFLCDKFYIAERADSPKYQDFINDLIAKEKIDLIIPGIEQDMYRLAELKDNINNLHNFSSYYNSFCSYRIDPSSNTWRNYRIN